MPLAADRKNDYGTGYINFLALLPEIQRAADDGHTLAWFYWNNRDRITRSYPQFARYWRKYKAANPKRAHPSSPSAEPRLQRTPLATLNQAAAKALPAPEEEDEKYRDFHYDPMDAYRRKWD
jgi:hypothetical protein